MLASTVKPLPKILADRPRLGRRLDDHQGMAGLPEFDLEALRFAIRVSNLLNCESG